MQISKLSMKRLVYFGSAFNPPHAGHIRCMKWLVARLNVDKVFAGPNKAHAFTKNMADFDIRCDMTQELLDHFEMPENVEICRIERNMGQDGRPVYTYDVLVVLRKLYPEYTIVFGLGPDNIEQFSRFYRYQDIINEFELEECPTMGTVRSTDIRNAAKEGNNDFIAQHTAPSLVQRVLKLYK